MNNPSDIEIDIAEQRSWLKEHKAATAMSWTELGREVGIKSSTLSLFGGDSYKGNNDELAKKIFRYRQTMARQATLSIEAPTIPGYFETRTSRDVMNLLTWAQHGRITYVAGGPGIGKTSAAREYQERASNVWMVTCMPSINSVTALSRATLNAMGDKTHGNFGAYMGARVINLARDSGGLLIFDDAQLLNVQQIEQIRCWYDQAGVGVALLGNETVAARMNGGDRRAAFAQIYSRVGQRIAQRPVALREDVEALADAWHIRDEQLFDFLERLAKKPGALRSCTQVLEMATMFARAQGEELSIKHLSGAAIQLGNRIQEA